MRTNAKRFLCMMLTAFMALSSPISVFAENNAGSENALTSGSEATSTEKLKNLQTGVTYEDIWEAFQNANEGETVVLLGNMETALVSVPEKVTLDLNGYTLEAQYVTCYGDIVDTSDSNEGILKVADKKILIQNQNAQIPAKTGEGYRFFEVEKYNTLYETAKSRYVFQPFIDADAHELIKAGASGVTIGVRISWSEDDGNCYQDFVYNEEQVQRFLDSYKPATGKYGQMFTLTLENADKYDDLEFCAVIVSDTGVTNKSEMSCMDQPAEPTATPAVTPEGTAGELDKDVTLDIEDASAVVAEGTKLDGKALALTTEEMAETTTDVELAAGEEMLSLNVHVDGIAKDNTVPVLVTINEIAPEYLNKGNITLYHVENGVTVEMTRVYSLEEVDEHNEFYYDILTGTVTMALASFSEIAVVSEEAVWEGDYDYSWYTNAVAPVDGEAVAEYTIANADQLAAFGAIVGGMNGQTKDSFKGKTVKLLADVNLGDKDNANESLIFYPIGYYYTDDKNNDGTKGDYYSTVYSFKGTFDGNGHTISNFYQNTWEIKGDYDGNYYSDAMGLFGYVNGTTTDEDGTVTLHGATVKNLTVDNFSSDGEFTPTGVIAAYAVNATFENIAITNCNPRVYNTGNGGIVGIGGNNDDPDTYKLTFENITIDNSNKISALWGSWDVACGGLVGMFRGAGHAYMTNCHVAAQIDVFNDVCGNYQYYWYRYAGMLIGTNKTMVKDENTGRTIPDTSKFTTANCTVHFGDWNDYYYCELVANSLASYTHDHQFSRLTEVTSVDVDNMTVTVGTGEAAKTTAIPTSGRVNYVAVNGAEGTANATCYHFVDGNVWNHDQAGKEIVDGEEVLKEDKQHVYLPFNQLVTGYGWGVQHVPITGNANSSDITYAASDFSKGITILGREVADSVVKFAKAETVKDSYTTESTVAIGELFKAAGIDDEKLSIKGDKVNVYVSPVSEKSTAGGTYTANITDWTKGTLKFSGTGAATITITDYYFCTPTTIEVGITEKKAEEKFETKFTGDFLYRVGNDDTTPVALGSLFEAKAGVEIGNVTVEVTPIDNTGASGTYTSNATDWTAGRIKFSGTGVVKVTITDDDYCIPKELYLEVVDAKNITTATGANGTDVVLLNNVKISSNATVTYDNCFLYGNGFTFDVSGGLKKYISSQGWGIINICNGTTLDNLVIVGDVYKAYGAYSDNDYNTAAVASLGGTIQNCHISNCATPVMARGTTDVIDTTLYGGTVANMIIKAGVNTLENVTTVNYDYGNRELIGMGIVVHSDADESAKLILNGKLEQYNFVCENKKPSDTNAQMLFNTMFSDDCKEYHFGDSPNRYVNTGIVSMVETFNDEDIKDNAETGYKGTRVTPNTVGKELYVYTQSNALGEIDNNYDMSSDIHKATVQGDYLPSFDFDLGNQEVTYDGDTDTRYLYGDVNGVKALYQEGDVAGGFKLDLTKLATAHKYTNKYCTVSAICKDSMGNELNEENGVITLSTGGEYILQFVVEDSTFYDVNGKCMEKKVERTYIVPLSLSVKAAEIKNAEITISSETLEGSYVRSGLDDWKLKVKFLECILVKDYSEGNKEGTDVDLSKNISSVKLINSSDNVFTAASTITITYNDGRILTVDLSKISGSSPGTKTANVYSSDGVYFETDGALNNKPTEKKNQNKCTITGVTFKGNNKATVTNNKVVNITWPLDSSSGSGGSCLAAGTKITMADGSKCVVENLRKGDSVMTFDHLTGEVKTSDVIIVVRTQSEYYKNTFIFDDGTRLATINEHGIYDLNLNKYVNIDHENADEYIGHTFVSIDINGNLGTKVLNDVESVFELGYKYDIVTDKTLNYVAEDTLSVTHVLVDVINSFDFGENMLYDQEKMDDDIEKYGLYSYDEWEEYCDISVFEQYNIPVMKVGISKGLYTKDYIIGLINTYVLDDSVQITE